MREFAQRLMMRGQLAAPNVATAIFGTAGSEGQAIYLGQPALRIGLWPVQSSEEPGMAMGLFTLLGLLLERWQGVRVYRMAARVDGDPASWRWSMPASQFGVDDWQLEDLDDNVGIWGELETSTDGLRLAVTVEDDRQPEDAPPAEFRLESATLNALVNALPGFCEGIVHSLGFQDLRRHAPLYAGAANERALQDALELAFQLELRLFLQLWGQSWPDAGPGETFEKIAGMASGSGEFIPWLYASSLARWLRHSGDSSGIRAVADRNVTMLQAHEAAAIIYCSGLFAEGQVNAAYDLLEAQENPGPAMVLTLADLYRQGGRVQDALELLQDAIESERASGELLVYYGDLLQAMNVAGLPCDGYVYLDPDEDDEEAQLLEALYAWEAAANLEPRDTRVLQRILVTRAELERVDDEFWSLFGRLVALDEAHEALRQVIDACYNLESLEPARGILQQAYEKDPRNIEPGLNLAEVLLVEQEEDALLRLLEKLNALAGDEASQAELARLRLMLEEPDLEWRLGEIEGVLDAGNSIRSEDTEWLEGILEHSPGLGGLHALLGRAYLGWGEDATALEILLDGYRRYPADAELAALLGEQLWQAGEAELAFEYLGKGLGENPNDVPLLALTGRFLFEDGQDEAARGCLARAEALAPRHPALQQARVHIAATLAG
ncbi:MAG: hypothetical protein OXF32_06090 [Anaerolineaceae bacterium]|nr:hypothetical protein [Anaerolineaceae bacterium]